MKQSIALFCILFVSVCLSQKPIFIIEMFRHGARELTCPRMYHTDCKDYGELTPVGMRQHYLIGLDLRQQYSHLFGEQYDPSKVYVRSTQFNRTIMSALSQLHGIYPPGSGPSLTPEDEKVAIPPFEIVSTFQNSSALPHAIQPVPVHVFEIEREYVLQPFEGVVCPKQLEYVQERHDSQDHVELKKALEPTVQKLEQAVKFTNLTLQDAFDTVDNLFAEYYRGMEIPTGFNTELWNEVTYLWDIVDAFYRYSGKDQIKLIKTPMMRDIVEKLEKKARNETQETAILYSGHDSTMLNLLVGLNILSWKCELKKLQEKNFNDFEEGCPRGPRYASNIIIELHQKSENEFFVKFIYDKHEIKLCGNEHCTLQQFKELALKDTVDDYFEECGLTKRQSIIETKEDGVNTSAQKWYYFVMGALGLLLVIFFITTIFFYRKSKKAQNKESSDIFGNNYVTMV